MATEETKPQGESELPPTVGENVPDVVKENLHGEDVPTTTEIPTANAPDPTAVNAGDNPNAANPATGKAPKEDAGIKPAKAKKEKAPGVEDKPFGDFIQQDYLPALKQGLENLGTRSLELHFEKRKIPIKGYDQAPECWQVIGKWQPSYKQLREFNIYFFDENINGLKGFACAEGDRLSTLESFLIDERKVTLELLVFGTVQRLNGQKWLARN
ncbi:DUF2996 domain-containing protein [Leptolyngbya sp. DQ-M1]|uniref:DUF2996 domain-containing protein n=1 Tax=Leptolyngbya sp. DQ-M1 TaxID=2933920 RepID=UPI003297DA30